MPTPRSTTLRLALAALLLATLAATPSAQTTWYVDATCVGPGDGSVASPFCTIRQAIDASVDGDEVLLADGIFTGPDNRALDFAGRAITVRSQNGPENCVVDAEHQSRHFVITLDDGEKARLRGLTLRNGQAEHGGSVRLVGDGTATLTEIVFEGNAADGFGGAIHDPSTLTLARLRDCVFRDNRTQTNGGACSLRGSAEFTNCLFEANIAESEGGAVWLGNGLGVQVVDFSGCVFVENHADDGGAANQSGFAATTWSRCDFIANDAFSGGALFLQSASANTFLDCSFLENSAVATGGAIVARSQQLEMERCRIERNTSLSSGGGIAIGNSDAVLRECVLAHNEALVNGGALWVFASIVDASVRLERCLVMKNTAAGVPLPSGGLSGLGGGVRAHRSASPELTLELTDCQVRDNTAENWGGGVSLTGGAQSTTMDTIFSGNTAKGGGALYLGGPLGFDDFHRVERTLVADNASRDVGGGIFAGTSATVEILNATIASNTSAVGGGIFRSQGTKNLVIENTIIWGNGEEPLVSIQPEMVFLNNCDVEGGFAGIDVLDVDPRFVAPADGVFCLRSDSPVRGQGIGSVPAFDLGAVNYDAYCDVGPANFGVAGFPTLTGEGSLEPDMLVALTLTNAAPWQPAWLVLGFDVLDAAFKGGVLVPIPQALIELGPTSTQGGLRFETDRPTGLPSFATAFLQAWISDPSTESGFSASQGLAATVP